MTSLTKVGALKHCITCNQRAEYPNLTLGDVVREQGAGGRREDISL